jgi:predicted dehydrogenase
MSANTLPGAFAQGSDEIRVGLIGCGGRGTGAARNVVDAAPGVRIVAMADAFKDRLDESRTMLAGKLGDKFAVTDDTCFVGLDAYQKVLRPTSTTSSWRRRRPFRAGHIKAAVAAGKHIFAEKPVAVDGRRRAAAVSSRSTR